MRALIGEGGECACCGDGQQLIEDRLADIDRRLKDLRHVPRVLNGALRECRQGNPRDACQVVEMLKETA